MPIIFDGKVFAKKKEDDLRKKVEDLKSRGINPKLVSILVGENSGSTLYTRLKKEAAERIGIEFEISSSLDDIEKLNADPKVHGIMVQMPLPEEFQSSEPEILNSIKPQKDVDGLREGSAFLHPTSKAVIQVIEL
ncbi:MAG: Bifunctional protein FolD, partial [Candidatus Woesebacteria bacterium GW2011_GWB1_45_5]